MTYEETLRKLGDAFNMLDAGAAAGCFSEEAVVHDPQYAEPLRGRKAIRKDFEDFFRAFPDMRSVSRNILMRDNIAAIEYDFGGTHSGTLTMNGREFSPEGKFFRGSGADFYTFDENGMIAEDRRYYDMLGLIEQLGLTERFFAETAGMR